MGCLNVHIKRIGQGLQVSAGREWSESDMRAGLLCQFPRPYLVGKGLPRVD